MWFGLSACSKKNNINTRFGQYLNSGVGEDDVEELKGNDERTIMGMHWWHDMATREHIYMYAWLRCGEGRAGVGRCGVLFIMIA
jgi:hypothetical protein